MAAKHTPAPWVADDFCMENDRRVRVGTTDGTKTYYHSTATVCECWVGESEDLIDGNGRRIGTVEAEANARLIAAAPGMLAALKALDAHWTAAFPGGPDAADLSYGLGQIAPDTIAVWRTARAALAKAEA
ncbi:hypothetical protein [Methylobacterium sp. WL19]|uniref:hypothetical protein n=1 Tax=Methylobacterium sp. WL19 TaxID=2603896 RepID=UPI0011CADCBD|nr:hypothetical protein [Methylobacterium sp. WL19]TXN33934.1 hypothetical protein FV220_00355 [Methylobacterium sp. WL19]